LVNNARTVLFEYERQNPFMYKFKGSFTVQQGESIGNKEFLSYENFIERGCSLQNTDWVIGVVVYSGHDTKIMMNSIEGKMKYSRVEKSMNR
jgi:phospholipid-transporting ATPase